MMISDEDLLKLQKPPRPKSPKSPHFLYLELWACPGCKAALDEDKATEISWADQCFLLSELLSNKFFPVMITMEFNPKGSIFLGFAELFALIVSFGGALLTCTYGEHLLQCFRAFQGALLSTVSTFDVDTFKDTIVNYFIPVELYLSPAIKRHDKHSISMIVERLSNRVYTRHQNGMRTRTYRKQFRKGAPTEAPGPRDHLDLTFSPHIKVRYFSCKFEK